MHAEIAGAGFAGLAAAIALRQRGWSVRVHEKEAALRAFGAGIFVWENGLRVLHAIGAYDDVVRGAPQPSAYESRRDGVSVTLEKVNGPNPFRLLTMTRQHLYAGILAAAQREGVEILTRSEAVGARPEGVLQLADGRSLPADLVIAADGVGPALRESLGVVGARRKHQEGAGPRRLLRHDERVEPGAVRVRRLRDHPGIAAVGGAGAPSHRPHPSTLGGACPHTRARQWHAMGRRRPARRPARPDRHPANGLRTAPARRAVGPQSVERLELFPLAEPQPHRCHPGACHWDPGIRTHLSLRTDRSRAQGPG